MSRFCNGLNDGVEFRHKGVQLIRLSVQTAMKSLDVVRVCGNGSFTAGDTWPNPNIWQNFCWPFGKITFMRQSVARQILFGR
jgi:hypothetical protein